jgi:hypothetical protein
LMLMDRPEILGSWFPPSVWVSYSSYMMK